MCLVQHGAIVIYSVDVFISAVFDKITFSGLLVFDYWTHTTVVACLPFSFRLWWYFTEIQAFIFTFSLSLTLTAPRSVLSHQLFSLGFTKI